MPVTAPADKRFRRAHLKPARKRGRLRGRRLRAAVWLAACGLVLSAAYRAVAFVERLDVFRVRTVAVHGNHRLSTGEVLGLLGGLQGGSILTVDLEEWRRRVMSSPWVAEAALRRTLPATVDVIIRERQPLGIARIGGGLYLIDDWGVIIDEYGPSYGDVDLPIIDGISSAADDGSNVYRATLARRLLDDLRAGNMAGQISQIDVSDSRNAVVLLQGDPTLIRLGNERFVERLRSYYDLSPALREQVPAIDYIDLRFDSRVYVRPARGAGGRTSAKPGQARGRATQTG
jgi:cell division protein FtsQ